MIRLLQNLPVIFLLKFPLCLLIFVLTLEGGSALPAGWQFTFARSFFGALASALLSLGLGFLIALGLLSLSSSRWKQGLRLLYLFPIFLPQIVVAFSVLSLLEHAGFLNSGGLAVVLTHGLMNAGLCGVVIERAVGGRLQNLITTARTLGASEARVVTAVLVPSLKPVLRQLLLLVVGFCLVSFVIPYMLSPAKAWSLEVLIFQSFRLQTGSGQAIALALGQYVLVLAMASWIVSSEFFTEGHWVPDPIFRFDWLNVSSLLFLCFLVFGVAGELVLVSKESFQMSPEFVDSWAAATLGSFQVAGLSLVWTALILFYLIWYPPMLSVHRYLTASLPYSPLILGLSLWTLGSNSENFSLLKKSVGIALLYFPILYRMGLGERLRSLKAQCLTARSLGASSTLIFQKILWPQTQARFFAVLAIFSMWAMGDFAITAPLNFGGESLSLLTESLVTSYRFDLAALTSFSILACGLLMAGTVLLIGRGLSRK